MERNAVFVGESTIRIGNENFRADDDFSYLPDCEFIERTSDTEINKNGFNGLYYSFTGKYYDFNELRYKEMALAVVGYITTSPDNEIKITYFKPKEKIKSFSGISGLFTTFKQTCSKYKNYSYFDLCCDIVDCITTEDEGPIKEVIISRDNLNERMYYYQNGITVAKIGNDSEILRNINFENVNDFTAFAEEVAQYCTENKLSYIKYINSDYIEQHLALRRNFVCEGKEMNANMLAVSFCHCGNAALVYYDNKKTMLITRNSETEKYFSIPVKLDKDFETAEEFQQWIKHNVKPYCQDHKTDYVGFVDELNKEYDKRFATELNQLGNDKQLDRLAGMPNNRENEGRQ